MKLIKITGFLIGENDIDEEEIALVAKSILGGKFDCIEKPFTVQSQPLPDWNEEHPLNSIYATLESCENYFPQT